MEETIKYVTKLSDGTVIEEFVQCRTEHYSGRWPEFHKESAIFMLKELASYFEKKKLTSVSKELILFLKGEIDWIDKNDLGPIKDRRAFDFICYFYLALCRDPFFTKVHCAIGDLQ